jgi:hypothetical protein
MNTNSIPYLDTITRWVESINNAPSAVLTLLLCIAAGYLWKSIKVLPNKFIPAVVMVVGGAALMALQWKTTEHLRAFVVGFFIGFVAWLIHNQVIKRIAKRFGLDSGDDEDDDLSKPTVKPETEKPKE